MCLLPGVGGVWSEGVSAPGGVCSQGCVCGIPACTEADTPPCEQNDRQVQKYYLGHNFVAAGNKKRHKCNFESLFAICVINHVNSGIPLDL